MRQNAHTPSAPANAPAQINQQNAEAFIKFRRIGVMSWSAIGVILLTVLVAGGISALSGILVPLVIAVVLGAVLEPVVTWLVRHHMPRALAAILVLTVTIVAATAMTVGLVYGFIQQFPEISQRLQLGWVQLIDWLRTLDIDPIWLEQLRAVIDGTAARLGQGAFGAVAGTLYATIMMLVGAFFAIYFLFFVLRDGSLFPGWLARLTLQNKALVTEIDAQVRQSIRGYFSGTAITALITAPIFVLPLLLLGIPLVIPMVVLYFFLSFVPYVGAWITGAFSILVAFGFGGPFAALMVTLGLLISNGPIQNAVLSWALGSSLNIHPVMVLISTIAGGVVAGALGMVLGPPVVSAIQKAFATVRKFREGGGADVGADADGGAGAGAGSLTAEPA